MCLFSNRIGFLGLALIISSCSVRNVAGIYSYKKGSARNYVIKLLELKRDSTFECTEDYHREPEEDVGAPVYRYVGKGHYNVNKKELTLNFDAKFRKIFKMEVVPLTPAEITEIRKNNSYIDQTSGGNYLLILNIYFNNFSFEHERFDSNIGSVKVNEQWFSRLRNNYIMYPVSNFPSVLTFDFGKFTGVHIAGYPSKLSAVDLNSLDFNFGFLNEKLRIGKSGNYNINIYPFKNDYSENTDQVFTGKRIYPISNVLGTKKVGDMSEN